MLQTPSMPRCHFSNSILTAAFSLFSIALTMIIVKITAWLTLGISSPWWLQRRRGFRLLLNCPFPPGFHCFTMVLHCFFSAGWGHCWLSHGKLQSLTCSSSWWEGISGMCCSCSHCSLLNWRGHTCPSFPYFPLFFFSQTSEIKTLPFL